MGCSLSFATILLGTLDKSRSLPAFISSFVPWGWYWLPAGGLVGTVPWVHVLW